MVKETLFIAEVLEEQRHVIPTPRRTRSESENPSFPGRRNSSLPMHSIMKLSIVTMVSRPPATDRMHLIPAIPGPLGAATLIVP
jgi:hypothetical protein